MIWAFKLAVTAWLVAVAFSDLRTGRIPNGLTLPPMLGVGAYRLAQGLYAWLPATARPAWLAPVDAYLLSLDSPLFVWIAWLALFGLWYLHVMGGGDAKLLMALMAIYPQTAFLFWFAVLVLLIGVPALLLSYRRGRATPTLSAAAAHLLRGRLLPTAEELEKRGRPYAWLFCAAGVIYTWLWA